VDKDVVSAGDKRPILKIREMLIDDIAIVFHRGEELFKAQEVPNMYRTWDPYEVVGLFNSDTEFCLVAEIDDAIRNVFQHHRLPWTSKAFRSHSDANQIWASGVKPVILGPGKLEQAHSRDESISFQQVCLAAEIYLDIMQTAVLEDRSA
jgi:hypothetical protein